MTIRAPQRIRTQVTEAALAAVIPKKIADPVWKGRHARTPPPIVLPAHYQSWAQAAQHVHPR